MRAIEVTNFGDHSTLEPADREVPEPDAGEVRVAVEAAGINFADIMQRRGLYPGIPSPPWVPGLEVAGTIDAVGDGVDREEGERVAAMVASGGYAEYAVADARSLLPIPDGLSFAEAAAIPVQFLTAHCCLFGWGDLADDERVLVHAAAGGVGTAAVQLADRAGSEVFGTASTAEKLDLAAELGCDHPINYVEDEFAERVDELTDGEGVDLVLDGVGGETFADSLDALAHFGRVVAYGVASGVPAQADTSSLLFSNHSVEGFHLGQAMRYDPARVQPAIDDVTAALADGEIEVVVGREFDLEDAAEAHRYIEDRESTGKVVLVP